MKNYFGFMDESGVLTPQADQRFFALGLLKLNDTSTLYNELVILKNRAISKMLLNNSAKGKPAPIKEFKFKFSNIKKSNYSFYYDLINLFFKFPHLSFCCLILDKKNPNLDIKKYFNDLWDAYISYSKLIISSNLKNNEKICIIADFLGKPKSSPKYYETEVKSVNGVFNACMIESHASLFIQLVDVLTGCIVYDYNIFRNKRRKTNIYKRNVCNFFKKKINKNILEGNFTINKPNYINVWGFKK